MTYKTAENIYILCNLLIEELDSLEGSNIFRQKLKFHAKELTKQIEIFDKNVADLTEANILHEVLNNKRKELLK